MKIEYTEAKLEFVEFDLTDIITTSVPGGDDEGGINPGGPDPSDEGYSDYH